MATLWKSSENAEIDEKPAQRIQVIHNELGPLLATATGAGRDAALRDLVRLYEGRLRKPTPLQNVMGPAA